MKKVLLVCAFVMGISAVTFAQGGGRRGGTPAEQADRLKTSLSLNDDQTAKIKTIYEAQTKTIDSLRTAANGDMASMRDKFMPIMTATATKIKAVLTPEQAAAFQKQQDERRARMQGGN